MEGAKLGTMSRAQSEADLIGHLANQLKFLRTSGAAYDAGDEAEAMRLAVTVRLLCHETKSSHALLGQLGLLDKLKFVDTATVFPPPEPSEEGRVFVMLSSPLAPMGPRGFFADLGKAERMPPKAFDVWWAATALEVPGHTMSRKEVVFALANQEGGAHVDPALTNAAYVAVSRDGAMGTISFTTEDGQRHTVDSNPVCAVMRQIAWEVEQTVASVFGQ
jgi:hypothetical protein